ncbi:MAG: tyrosine-type recombinase/integrase [Pirellulaceae bacterium]
MPTLIIQTKRYGKRSTRRGQQIASSYAAQAGIKAMPHTFRHQFVTWLIRNSGLAAAELRLITGHSWRETLSRYQHVAWTITPGLMRPPTV